ncbi:MAG: HPr family phosphocarrier protein [Microbacteriaceae bacterium]|nr:MAG: HPr family phosphocarrier protein [Microbacteriaceae bacterium]
MSSTGSTPRVGIVIVSHSELIAAGVVELVRQMAPNVSLKAAGGTADGALGTSFDRVTSALAAAFTAMDEAAAAAPGPTRAGSGVVVLCDLGSAVLMAETARELLDADRRGRVLIADAPLVEGAVAAAVAAEIGDDLRSVCAAAESARGVAPVTGARAASSAATPVATAASSRESAAGEPPAYVRTVTLINRDGLHARPAADFVRLAATFPARVTVNGKDAKSLLGIMSLGLMRGAHVELSAQRDGAAAVDALARLIESGFGEESPL